MATAGYYRYPTINRETVVFACESDLWSVPATGGIARRLTANPGQASHPALSPDGSLLAFSGHDEGVPEIYLMAAGGGPATRLTYLGADTTAIGWDPAARIIFSSSHGQPFPHQTALYAITPDGGEPERLPTGLAHSISFGPDGGRVIGRHTSDLATWKRYRGGRTGDLWIDQVGDGNWRRLLSLAGNLTLPLWVGERIYFISDHEGIGNLYSCRPEGHDLRRHTHHADFYARHPATDGQRIVYHAGADLYLFDPQNDASERIEVEFYSPQIERKRKFINADASLNDYAIHPSGSAIALTARGRPFSFPAWDGPVLQHGDSGAVRYRFTNWLHDGLRLVAISDEAGEDALVVFQADASAPPDRLEYLDIGRPINLAPSPKRAQVALANHRNELLLVDIDARAVRVLDRNQFAIFHGIAWSPDGSWLAYSAMTAQDARIIKLCRLDTGETWEVTHPICSDTAPSFDPDGRYLYFIGARDFNPVPDNLRLDYGFPRSERPFLLTLHADLPSPFTSAGRAASDAQSKRPKPEQSDDKNGDTSAGTTPLRIDLDGIADRIVAFPVPEGRYHQVFGLPGKAIFTAYVIDGTLNSANGETEPSRGRVEMYDFAEQKQETLVEGINRIELSPDHRWMLYRSGGRLRLLKAGEKPADNGGGTGKRTGWIDLGRVRVEVEPQAEWEQMYREAWRLQREYFWSEDMSGVDWQAVFQRYLPLLSRVATRREFSDLLSEMQGELGTSHAYVSGGDFRPSPYYAAQGFLGADLRYDAAAGCYRFERIVAGDIWNEAASSPLARPGINLRNGDRLLAIGGRLVGADRSPGELLVNQAGTEVLLSVADADGLNPRSVTVRTLRSERPARYRDWVEANRRRVHQATDGRVGYLHIPDMHSWGFAEFHRGYLSEWKHAGLIVDVRFNGGGNVSGLLLEKLARRRLGYKIRRWGALRPYPYESLAGPVVAICNEDSASDGDIFSHAFKLLSLGPLIGKRTWGGVIGYFGYQSLIDGGGTSQPASAIWFPDVQWQVENYGTDPDIEVDITPQDYIAGLDPQLERAIVEITRRLDENPPQLPDFGPRPRRTLPS